MTDDTIQVDHLATAGRVVIKIGSSLLVDPVSGIRKPWLE